MVDFQEIKDKVKEVRFDALRLDEGNILEVVVVKENLAKLIERLESFFGIPVFPSKNKLSAKVSQIIGDFGGIMPGQTLYYSDGGESIIFAMLWPWQDGIHATLKIIRR